MKRLFDGLVALVAVVVMAPLWVALALLIKWDSRGPVFFRQERMGRHMRPFRLWKFRSMRHEAAPSGPQLTVGGDPRITRVGAFLRRTKLDELPQLLNVLSGDMSVVGPRPEVPRYVELFPEDYKIILTVRPGLTDPASLHYRNESALLSRAVDPEREYVERILPDKIRRAKAYVTHASPMVDVVVIVKTLLEAVGLEAMPIAGAGGGLRRRLVWVVDVACMVAAYLLAWQVRFDGVLPPEANAIMWRSLPWVVLIRSGIFALFRVHRGMWRYAGLSDAGRIVAAVVASAAALLILAVSLPVGAGHPRSVFVIDALLLLTFTLGGRVLRRVYHDAAQDTPATRVLVYGTGDEAEMALRGLRKGGEYLVVGLIDHDPANVGASIHGVPILGGRVELRRIVSETRAVEVLVALPADITDAADVEEELGRLLEPLDVRVTRCRS